MKRRCGLGKVRNGGPGRESGKMETKTGVLSGSCRRDVAALCRVASAASYISEEQAPVLGTFEWGHWKSYCKNFRFVWWCWGYVTNIRVCLMFLPVFMKFGNFGNFGGVDVVMICN